jgi:uncharacterized protein YfcZ (UPF0381/DUF406 family)
MNNEQKALSECASVHASLFDENINYLEALTSLTIKFKFSIEAEIL